MGQALICQTVHPGLSEVSLNCLLSSLEAAAAADLRRGAIQPPRGHCFVLFRQVKRRRSSQHPGCMLPTAHEAASTQDHGGKTATSSSGLPPAAEHEWPPAAEHEWPPAAEHEWPPAAEHDRPPAAEHQRRRSRPPAAEHQRRRSRPPAAKHGRASRQTKSASSRPQADDHLKQGPPGADPDHL